MNIMFDVACQKVRTDAIAFGAAAAAAGMSHEPAKYSDLMNMVRGLDPSDPLFVSLTEGFQTGYALYKETH